ncbi:hypothetical protein HK097_005420 [Rhizophlyctis rosea]|uniref:Helicase ATP-binding domain-containing protein n=1 Tax=Rhizophlyctis rosea TaxID=64517 RepID=A0AAD5SF63_9FUNG|nr:hypothetical protein HK097_005420 [Rhizophlyctis rosea]
MPAKRKTRAIVSESESDEAPEEITKTTSTQRAAKQARVVTSDSEDEVGPKSAPTSPVNSQTQTPLKQRQPTSPQTSTGKTKQTNLGAYFNIPKKTPTSSPTKGRGRGKVDNKVDKMDIDDEEEYDEEEDDEEVYENTGPKKGSSTTPTHSKKGEPKPFYGKSNGSDLPPISDITAIFSDIVSHSPKLPLVATHLQGRPLRVATMCSGTESPLLALGLITRALEDQYGATLEVEHVFSCEIEPFKQAYIERNFKPPILFRDVCELGGKTAKTAYGAEVEVPGNVDMLIAGTSCVDYSSLNNEKKTLNQKGESGRTFLGMMGWVKNHRPPIVILENVCGAPWVQVSKFFEEAKYYVTFGRLDTKDFYIPHTRTRVYLFAVSREKGSKADWPKRWMEMVKGLQRPSSSPLEAFLLPSDDPRIHEGREELAKKKAGGKKAGRIDWARCESRHQLARDTEKLGIKRPLTVWEDGSICKLPDYAWNDWGRSQTERVLDLMDINFLRLAKTGIDAIFKTLVWNLSQNVDRNTGSSRPGICPCLTPSMIPFVTNRGGPLIGLEALSLQGLPIDELILTRESQDNLADLAGNAMSSTVVGCCMIAALVLVRDILKPGPDAGKEMRRIREIDDVSGDVVGEEGLRSEGLELARVSGVKVEDLVRDARRSARFCECEGRKGFARERIMVCGDCGFSSCVRCGGRPEHNYVPLEGLERLDPTEFEREVCAALPMRVSFVGIVEKLFEVVERESGVEVDSRMWDAWKGVVLESLPGAEFRFRSVKRQDLWVVLYDSERAELELWLDPKQPEWRVKVKSPPGEAVNSKLRALLLTPVARMKVVGETSLLEGTWELCLPVRKSFKIGMEGEGELVPAWEARLGLTEPQFSQMKWWSKLRIRDVPEEAKTYLDRDIEGSYKLFEKCGTAMGALHKKEENGDEQIPLFLFLDPTRCEEQDMDPFVLSSSIRRLGYGDERVCVATFDAKWRPSSFEGVKSVGCHVTGKWVSTDSVQLTPAAMDLEDGQAAVVATPASIGGLAVTLEGMEGCKVATAVVSCRVPVGKGDGFWPRGRWETIDLAHKGKQTFEAISWVTERVPTLTEMGGWMEIDEGDVPKEICHRCAPAKPEVKWILNNKKHVPLEDVVQAGVYEQAMKRRPQLFVVQLREDDGIGKVRIGVNVVSLLHRAMATLPPSSRTDQLQLLWHLTTEYQPSPLNRLTLCSNRPDPKHTQPPHFKVDLRPEQLRSLHWMLKQEEATEPTFIEEEVAEAELPSLGWRVEGKAQRPVLVRGGVLADEVGYGKTAITLGLIDVAKSKNGTADVKVDDGLIGLKATLIIVPPHLTKQWPDEIRKFTGSHLSVVAITSVANLNKLTVADFAKADVVVIASSVFRSAKYLENFSDFSGVGGTLAKGKGGRHFVQRYENMVRGVKDRVRELKKGSEGVKVAWMNIQEGRSKPDATEVELPSKRLVGKQYHEEFNEKTKTGVKTAAKKEVKEEKVVKKARKEEEVEEVEENGPERPVRKTRKQVAEQNNSIEFYFGGKRKSGGNGSDSSEEENESPKPVRKRGRVIIESDDDEEDFVPAKKGKGKKKVESDYEDDGDAVMEEAEEEVATPEEEEEEEEVPVKKTAAKKPAAKTKAANADPWGLKTLEVQRDWKKMMCPPLEMFHFNRVVVDEFTYLQGAEHAAIVRLESAFNWVLSGTPPVHDFTAVKTMAVYLKVHLGIDDDAPPEAGRGKNSAIADKTQAEKFHAYREVRSHAWHARRHQVAQMFLDKFVRQNIAEIEEIPFREDVVEVVLPAAERAIYLELDHHLQAMEMNTKKTIKSAAKGKHGDRESRLKQALGNSESAEEALMKRCSHFDELDGRKYDDAKGACEAIVEERKKQLEECQDDLAEALENAKVSYAEVMRMGGFQDPAQNKFVGWQREVQGGLGDEEADAIIRGLLKASGFVGKEMPKPGKPAPRVAAKKGLVKAESSEKAVAAKGKGKVVAKGKAAAKPKATKAKAKPKAAAGKGKRKARDSEDESDFVADDDEEDAEEEDVEEEDVEFDEETGEKKQKKANKLDDVIMNFRELTHGLRRLHKELVGRVRSLRYFAFVRDVQTSKDLRKISTSCAKCGKTTEVGPSDENHLKPEEIAVLSCCGHTGCEGCLKASAIEQMCTVEGCKAPARLTNVILASTLGKDDAQKSGRFGAKLQKLVELLKTEVLPKKERALVFVQFPDLMDVVAQALDHAKIPTLQVKGSAHTKSTALNTFQQVGGNVEPVLLLSLGDESASGANLTTANHAIFFSPYLADTQEIYVSHMTQAIGRVRRYGQSKEVRIWSMMTLDTIDTEIWAVRKDAGKD